MDPEVSNTKITSEGGGAGDADAAETSLQKLHAVSDSEPSERRRMRGALAAGAAADIASASVFAVVVDIVLRLMLEHSMLKLMMVPSAAAAL